VSGPRIPRDLGTVGRRVYRSVVSEWDLSTTELVALHELARCADTMERLASAMADAPATVTNSRGDQTINPIIREARAQQQLYARLLASLRIPQEDVVGQPQRRGAVRAPYIRSVP
jgi:hypothetical protein